MSNATRSRSITLTVSIPVDWVEWLDRETSRRRFANRSEMVREALRRMLDGAKAAPANERTKERTATVGA